MCIVWWPSAATGYRPSNQSVVQSINQLQYLYSTVKCLGSKSEASMCTAVTAAYHTAVSINKTRLPSNVRQDHPRMHACSYVCSLPVMWQSWRLHHSICCTRKPHAACKHHVWQNGSYSRSKFYIAGIGCTDDLHMRTWPVVRGDMPHVQIWTCYVKAVESYHLTDIQTRPKLYTMLLRGWSNIHIETKTHTVSTAIFQTFWS